MKKIVTTTIAASVILLMKVLASTAEESIPKSAYGDTIYVKEQKVIVSTIELETDQQYLVYENDLVLLRVPMSGVKDRLRKILENDADEAIDILTDVTKQISPNALTCEEFRYLGNNGISLSQRIVSELLDQGNFILIEKATAKVVEKILMIDYSAGTGNLGMYGGVMYLLPTGEKFFEMLTWVS